MVVIWTSRKHNSLSFFFPFVFVTKWSSSALPESITPIHHDNWTLFKPVTHHMHRHQPTVLTTLRHSTEPPRFRHRKFPVHSGLRVLAQWGNALSESKYCFDRYRNNLLFPQQFHPLTDTGFLDFPGKLQCDPTLHGRAKNLWVANGDLIYAGIGADGVSHGHDRQSNNAAVRKLTIYNRLLHCFYWFWNVCGYILHALYSGHTILQLFKHNHFGLGNNNAEPSASYRLCFYSFLCQTSKGVIHSIVKFCMSSCFPAYIWIAVHSSSRQALARWLQEIWCHMCDGTILTVLCYLPSRYEPSNWHVKRF